MGRLVNVVLPSGRIVAVDEEVARASQLSTDTLSQEAVAAEAGLNEERTSGAVEGLKAGAEGAADALTLGGYGAVRGALDPAGARDMRIRARERGGARMVGEAAALALPFAGQAGLLGRAGGAAVRGTAPGIARGVGELAEQVGGKIAGRAAEGAIQGVGGYISSTNVSGDPLTIESAVEAAGLGALIDVGMGAAADRLEGAVWNNKFRDAKNHVLAEDLKVADKGRQLFDDPPPSWNEFVESHAVKKKAVESFNKEVAKETEEYAGFYQNNAKLTAAIDSAQEAVDHVRHGVYKKRGGPFGGTPEKVKYNLDSSGNAKQVEYTYEGAKVRVGFEGEGASKVKGPMGEEIPVQGEPKVRQMQYDVDPRQQIGEKTLERLKDYSARISRAYQMKGGGWAMKESKWVRDASAPANPMGALEELRAIKRDFMVDYPGASGIFKELPNPPRETLPAVVGQLPRSLDDFARKHAPQIDEIAQGLDEQGMAALGRVLKDLDIAPRATARESLDALHETLRTYRDKIGEISTQAAKLEAEESKRPALLRWLNKAARYTGGRVVDTGGGWGAIRRQVGGELVGKAMTAVEGAALGYAAGGDVEDAALGAMLMTGRVTMRQRVRNLITKYGVPTAALARKLGPVTAYLKSSFPNGAEDSETSHGRLAINRIAELNSAAMVAPDAAFMAVQGMLGHPSDVGFKMHQHVVGTLSYLVSTLPRDPGTDTTMFESNWTPQYHEAIALAHRLEAVNDPITAIARSLAGDGHPASTEALWAVYPSIMQELAHEISVASPNLKSLTYEQASAYSNLFRTPLTGLQQPATVMTIQGLYMRGPSQMPPPGPGGGARPKAVGRPPAVQSGVAGSNVQNLIR